MTLSNDQAAAHRRSLRGSLYLGGTGPALAVVVTFAALLVAVACVIILTTRQLPQCGTGPVDPMPWTHRAPHGPSSYDA